MTTSSPTASAPAVRLRGITKAFGAVTALSGVDATVEKGEVIGLIGENGAGKSTLVKILAGLIPADTYGGAVEVDGTPVRLRSPQEAARRGAVLIPQELMLHPDLSVAENILLGRLPHRGGLVAWQQLRRSAQSFAETVGLTADVGVKVDTLPPSERQLVAIARGLASRPRLLMLDEPTAALDTGEVDRLLDVVRSLAQRGVAILYVSHRLGEVMAISDRVLVLRNGSLVANRPTAEIDRAGLISAMLGDADFSAAQAPSMVSKPGKLLLRARGIEVRDPRSSRLRVAGVDVDLHEGEVVGLVGLLGSGRTELLWALYGATGRRGQVEVSGRSLPASPRRSVGARVGLLTEERQATSLFPLLDVAANVSVASLGSVSAGGWLRRGREHALAARLVERFGVKTAGTRQRITALSGGNQQKLLLGRWIARDVQVLLLDEPTRGIDVGAKADVYSQIRELAEREHRAVLVTSSDISELVGVCDRYLVLWRGQLVAEVPAADASEGHLLDLAAHGGRAPRDEAATRPT